MTIAPEAPYEVRALARTLTTLRSHGRMDAAFGGRVLPGASTLEITQTCGTRTRSVTNLVVRNGAGIGGKSLMLGRPVSVTNYLAAEGITHAYDHAVRPEAFETVAVLPIVVDRVPRLMIYLATRAQVGLGDQWFDSFRPIMRRLERDIAVDDEVRRRLAHIQAANEAEPTQSMLSRADLRDIADDLADLAGLIEDVSLQARVESVQKRCAAAAVPAQGTSPLLLSPREVDVLQEVARGLSNREIGDVLGLLPNTVKSYLKTAMRKLQAANRVQAIVAAREAGVIN